MILNAFVEPLTKTPLDLDANGNAVDRATGEVRFELRDGSFDFSPRGPEREFYETHWDAAERDLLAALEPGWEERLWPGEREVLAQLGPLSGKTILLLGNGLSSWELNFLDRGAKILFTDLTLSACERMRNVLLASRYRGHLAKGNIEFHATDARHLPFTAGSVDAIYGRDFLHHVREIEPLLKELHRCLRPGGRCTFLDGAYSPVWQLAKKTVLRPLQIYSHKRWGFSPEDHAASAEGGYRETQLEELAQRCGYRELVFRKHALLSTLGPRGCQKLLGIDLEKRRPDWVRALGELDRKLAAASDSVRANLLEAVFSFVK